jgi:hypothetical protein
MLAPTLASPSVTPGAAPSGRFAAALRTILAIELPFIFVASNPIVGDDIWWLLKYGQLIVERGLLPGEDPFTFTPLEAGAINQPWFAEVVFYAAYAAGGPALLLTLSAILAATTFGLVFAAAWERTHSGRVAAVVGIAAFGLVAANLSTRAQLVAFVLFALSAYAMTAARTRPRWLVAVPLAEVIWVNSHGSFPLGLVLVACACTDVCWTFAQSRSAEAKRQAEWYGLTFVATGAAMLLNPHGVEALNYVQRIGSNPIIRGLISEWRPPTLSDPNGIALFVSFALVGLALYRSPQRLSPGDTVLLLLTGGLALQAVRNVAWWGLIAAPIAAVHLSALPEVRSLARRFHEADARARSHSQLPAVAAAFAVGLALLISLPWVKSANPLLPPDKRGVLDQNLPISAAQFARDLPPGRVYNYQLWGGYLLWELWPIHQVFGDGRIEIHPPRVWADYQKLRLGHVEWRELLDAYRVDYLFLHPEDQRDLLALAESDAGWRVLYRDHAAVLLGRVGGPL